MELSSGPSKWRSRRKIIHYTVRGITQVVETKASIILVQLLCTSSHSHMTTTMSPTAHEELTLAYSPARQIMTLQEIWQTLKDYFGDGYIRHSVPFRFNVHLCETHKVPVHNDNVFLGVQIDKDMMPLFGSLG